MQKQRSQQAIIYAAKSTEDKLGSIPTQLADCRALATAARLRRRKGFRWPRNMPTRQRALGPAIADPNSPQRWITPSASGRH